MNENTLASAASLLATVFSALSLSKIVFSENETAILLALKNRKINEADCFTRMNIVLVEHGYGEIGRNEFDRAINNLYDCKCVLITEGIVEINGKIKS